ncbi:MAG: hypothetical protein WCZ43_04555 [Proteiniphilum sp.]
MQSFSYYLHIFPASPTENYFIPRGMNVNSIDWMVPHHAIGREGK